MHAVVHSALPHVGCAAVRSVAVISRYILLDALEVGSSIANAPERRTRVITSRRMRRATPAGKFVRSASMLTLKSGQCLVYPELQHINFSHRWTPLRPAKGHCQTL